MPTGCWDLQQPLDYTQSLYEKKLCTYPRTDSRYLTDDMAGMLPELVERTAAAFDISENLSTNAGQVFTAKGKTVLQEGWKATQKFFFEDKSKEAAALPQLAEGTILPLTSFDMKESKTPPPKHFTEDLLLQTMETAIVNEFPDEAERKASAPRLPAPRPLKSWCKRAFWIVKEAGRSRCSDIRCKCACIAPDQQARTAGRSSEVRPAC